MERHPQEILCPSLNYCKKCASDEEVNDHVCGWMTRLFRENKLNFRERIQLLKGLYKDSKENKKQTLESHGQEVKKSKEVDGQ